jgi:hypothetical protein
MEVFLFVLSGRGLCDELITHPEDSYRLWSVVVCDQETSWTRRLCSPRWAAEPEKIIIIIIIIIIYYLRTGVVRYVVR